MNSKDDSKTTLNYGHPRPRAPYPPLLREVGCFSSAVGVIVFGVVLPCAGFQYVMTHAKDPGGPLFWPLAAILGGIAGAVGVPLVTLLVYWLAWRIAGRP
jgi:hypothetical protein